MYAAYNKMFFDTMKEGMDVVNKFDAMSSTAFWEQYMMNSFQFSAAKSRAKMKELQSLVYNADKELRPYNEFVKEARQVTKIFNETWLRTEYDLANRGSVLAEEWARIQADKDIMPYAFYKTMEDDRVREEHAELDGICFPVDSPEASDMYVPNGWNCRCYWETTDKPKGILSEKEIADKKDEHISKDFQYNVGKDGIMPSDKHSYFDVLPTANDASSEMFGTMEIGMTKLNSEWVREYNARLFVEKLAKESPIIKHKDKKDIIFKNRKFLLNVKADPDKLQKIAKKSRGIENIKRTIEQPDEIYGRWANPERQKDVRLFYFSHDEKYSYVVETLRGEVVEAKFYLRSDAKANRKRGIKFII